MDDRPPAPSPTAPTVELASLVDAAITACGRAVRREVRRTALGLVFGLISVVLLLVVALGFVVAGVMRLGDALGQLCGAWLGNQALGDLTVGLVLVVVPIVGALIARRSIR